MIYTMPMQGYLGATILIDILYMILGFIVAIGVLTTVHEFGHFWMARKLNVKVERFAIGFGYTLLSWHDKTGTEFVISLIPFGGYVKLLGEHLDEHVDQSLYHRSLALKPAWIKISISAAGPLFNLIFALLAYWFVFVNGVSYIVPMVGDVPRGTIAYKAGITKNSEITHVAGQKVRNWEEVAVILAKHAGDKSFVEISTKNNKIIKNYTLNLTSWSASDADGNILESIGLHPFDPIPPIVGKVLPNSPAYEAGLHSDDRLVKVDDLVLKSRSQFQQYVKNKKGQHILLTVEREHENIELRIVPKVKLIDGGEEIGYIGIQFKPLPWPRDLTRVNRLGLIDGFFASVDKTWNYIVVTYNFICKMLRDEMSMQHISGPISIAKFAGITASSGLESFVSFLALLSIGLGILNLLPIPTLDGGNILLCIFESIRSRPISVQTRWIIDSIGYAILIGFVILSMFNDIIRL
jgi:regulator of sigma E protease